MESSVKERFNQYPCNIKPLLLAIRKTILSIAHEESISDIQETTKWGEPSYVNKIGSTIRFDWKAKNPTQYCIYFNCKTSLVETFKELYGGTFQFEGDRAIVFNTEDSIPWEALKHCISLSLRYHKLKHLYLLGC